MGTESARSTVQKDHLGGCDREAPALFAGFQSLGTWAVMPNQGKLDAASAAAQYLLGDHGRVLAGRTPGGRRPAASRARWRGCAPRYRLPRRPHREGRIAGLPPFIAPRHPNTCARHLDTPRPNNIEQPAELLSSIRTALDAAEASTFNWPGWKWDAPGLIVG